MKCKQKIVCLYIFVNSYEYHTMANIIITDAKNIMRNQKAKLLHPERT